MTRQADIERLARFMGAKMLPCGCCWDKEGGSDFDPFTRLDDALMVAEKIAGNHKGCFDLSKDSDDDWWAKFDKPGEDRHWVNHETALPQPWVGVSGSSAAEAIALAALAYLDAVGFK